MSERSRSFRSDRLFGGDVVGYLRWFWAEMQGENTSLNFNVRNRHPLVLAKVFKPGLDDEFLEIQVCLAAVPE